MKIVVSEKYRVFYRIEIFGAWSRIGLQNAAEHGLVNGKGFRVPAAHHLTEIYPPLPFPGDCQSSLRGAFKLIAKMSIRGIPKKIKNMVFGNG